MIAAVLLVFRQTVVERFIIPVFMKPSGDFNPAFIELTDYENDENWAALPERLNEPSDTVPTGFMVANAGPAVFFITPTAALFGKNWNRSIVQERDDWLIHNFMLAGQASAFSPCCRVFAPYYQEASFYSFLPHDPVNGDQAVDAAYGDVRRAFRNFLEKRAPNQPFIIAGHSQGSGHGLRLILTEVLGTPAERNFVAAYLPGYRVTDRHPVSACGEEVVFGCILAWNTYIEGSLPANGVENIPVYFDGSLSRKPVGNLICNPPAPIARNYLSYLPRLGVVPGTDPGACVDGLHYIERPKRAGLRLYQLSPGWLHAYEYALPWRAVGVDAGHRFVAWHYSTRER